MYRMERRFPRSFLHPSLQILAIISVVISLSEPTSAAGSNTLSAPRREHVAVCPSPPAELPPNEEPPTESPPDADALVPNIDNLLNAAPLPQPDGLPPELPPELLPEEPPLEPPPEVPPQ